MISHPSVIVTCDLCGAEHEVHLHDQPGEIYDMSRVRPELRRKGWDIEDGSDDALCADCAHLDRAAAELRAAAAAKPKRRKRGGDG
ncbi:hypothetical protein [Chelatococcus reniformis]|uniref:Uncharacterized protein n=1 Tax=Chelatococcus reniformis TaxID=1494448 RepID=A0A916UGP3_9HYPH|nr:hypothetical protein [Chelatococcus reniformis]GGC70383.1 hypothetical protein GCM10010994_31130 [Chelatococcus reniformis]